ncbi:Serine/threonine-protein kinase HT1 [Pelomyxa schiedti]|nr:Serine/threonine-protein kinase HT1 [Pelomyxa schiedti]
MRPHRVWPLAVGAGLLLLHCFTACASPWCINVVGYIPTNYTYPSPDHVVAVPIVSCDVVSAAFVDEGYLSPSASPQMDAVYTTMKLQWWVSLKAESSVLARGPDGAFLYEGYEQGFHRGHLSSAETAYDHFDGNYGKENDLDYLNPDDDENSTGDVQWDGGKSYLDIRRGFDVYSTDDGVYTRGASSPSNSVSDFSSSVSDSLSSSISESSSSEVLEAASFKKANGVHFAAVWTAFSVAKSIGTTMTVSGLAGSGQAPTEPAAFNITMSCKEPAVVAASVTLALSDTSAVVTFAPRWMCYTQGCPSWCSLHGVCDTPRGTCVCNPGWIGADCGIKVISTWTLCPQDSIILDFEIPYTIAGVIGAGNTLFQSIISSTAAYDYRYLMTWSTNVPSLRTVGYNTNYTGTQTTPTFLPPGTYGMRFGNDAADTILLTKPLTIKSWAACNVSSACGNGTTNTCGSEIGNGVCVSSACKCSLGRFWYDCSRGCSGMIKMATKTGSIQSDYPESGNVADMRDACALSTCSWLISPPNSYDEVMLNFTFVEMDFIGILNVYKSDENATKIDLAASINNNAPAPFGVQSRHVLVVYEKLATMSAHGFALSYYTHNKPLSSIAIGFTVFCSILGGLILTTAGGLVLYLIITRQKRKKLQALNEPAIEEDMKSPEEISKEREHFEAQNESFVAAGFQVDKQRLMFSLTDTDPFPIQETREDVLCISNNTGRNASYCIFVPKKDVLMKFDVKPGKGKLSAGTTLAVGVKFELRYTTHYDYPIRLEVTSSNGTVQSMYITVKFEGAHSIWIDPEDVLLDQEVLATGSFGSVHRGAYKAQMLAIKVLKDQEGLTDGDVADFETECRLLNQVHHPKIAQFIGASHVPGKYYITPSGNLAAYLKSRAEIPFVLVLKWAQNTAEALSFLHENKILYGDLKCSNLLLVSTAIDASVNCKLTDFGTARIVDEIDDPKNYVHPQGTPAYLAPEIHRNAKETEKTRLNYAIDVYSFGMCLWEMWSREEPWSSLLFWDIAPTVISGKRPHISSKCPEMYAELMKRCWVDSPKERPHFDAVNKELDFWIKPAIEYVRQNLQKLRHNKVAGLAVGTVLPHCSGTPTKISQGSSPDNTASNSSGFASSVFNFANSPTSSTGAPTTFSDARSTHTVNSAAALTISPASSKTHRGVTSRAKTAARTRHGRDSDSEGVELRPMPGSSSSSRSTNSVENTYQALSSDQQDEIRKIAGTVLGHSKANLLPGASSTPSSDHTSTPPTTTTPTDTNKFKQLGATHNIRGRTVISTTATSTPTSPMMTPADSSAVSVSSNPGEAAENRV